MRNKKNQKILCVCSPGGHLTEMVNLVGALDLKQNFVYVTHKGITEKIFKSSYLVKNSGFLRNIPALSYKIARIIIKEKPNFIISTGAEIGMLAIFLGKILTRTKTIYIECSAQVKKPSLSGRIAYHFSDIFFVQWKSLLRSYGKNAKYKGNLIFGNL